MSSLDYCEFAAQTQRINELQGFIYHKYPDHAEKAKEMINSYLRFNDHHRYQVFNDLVLDKNDEYYHLNSAHLLISDMLHYRDNGGTATELQMDVFARKYLNLPPPVIEGGQSD